MVRNRILVIEDDPAIRMPEMGGYAVVTAVRQSPALASIPFIFLTARGERAEMRKGMNLGHSPSPGVPVPRLAAQALLDALK